MSAAPATVAPVPAGYPAEAFRVALPMLFVGSGVPPPDLPECTSAQVVAKAATIRTVDGVDGVIQLDGPGCSLDIRQGPTGLLDADGQQLAMPLYPVPPADNPPMSRGGGFALAAGHALWGFAIDGSWCGVAPAFVVVPLTTDPATTRVTDLKVPLTGPAPPCKGQSDAELRPGVSGSTALTSGTAEAVLPAPSHWQGLRLTLHVEPVTKGAALDGLSATISNPTGSPISLSPCPSYTLFITGGNGDSVSDGTFGCSQARFLAPSESATYSIPGKSLDLGSQVGPATGTKWQIQLAIAGVPTGKTTTRVG